MDSDKTQEKPSGRRTRNYAFVLYKDSAPGNWMQVLEDTHVPMFVSPYHDKDKNPDGTQKKPHWHILVMFQSVKTKKQFEELRDRVAGVGVEEVASVRGYARYLCHLDNPEKAQYEKSDVAALSGADYDAVVHLPTDDTKTVMDMMRYCRANHVTSFAEFCDMCSVNNQDWFTSLVHRTTYIMKE